MTLNFKILLAIILVIIGGFLLFSPKNNPAPTPTPSPVKSTINTSPSGSAKGVVMVDSPVAGSEIKSPLIVSGFVYSKKGTLTITLKQKESGAIVTTPKIVKIQGQADKISFVEALQFGLPVKPQVGILELSFKDESGKGADDKFSIPVQFPSDLGK